jgi:hypothetical protein
MFKVIDFKKVEMTNEEYEYYQEIIKEFTDDQYSGKEQFHNVFETDEDGCISIIKPPLKSQIAWVVIFFLQNLMLNQRIRRLEKWVLEKK